MHHHNQTIADIERAAAPCTAWGLLANIAAALYIAAAVYIAVVFCFSL